MKQTPLSKTLTVIVLIAIAVALQYLTACSSIDGSLTIPTEYGTATVRSEQGRGRVDLVLPPQ